MSDHKRKKNLDHKDQMDQGQVNNLITTNDGRAGCLTCSSALEALPPELWELIFQNLESPKDLLSCRDTAFNSAWSTALRSTDFYFKMTLPFVLPYLSRRELLQCGATSKFWNATVDACLQIHETEDFVSDDWLTQKGDQRIVLNLHYKHLPVFISRFNLSRESRERIIASNPVAFRRVKFNLLGIVQRDKRERARSNVLQILDHYGHLIRNFSLVISYRGFEILKLIRNCLRRMPNLRHLHILTESLRERNGSREEFDAYISENPWPPLQHLKTLKFGSPLSHQLYSTTALKSEFNCIANSYAPQLVYLQFCSRFELGNPDQPTRFPCLREIILIAYETHRRSNIELEAFVRSSQCPLKKLTILLFSHRFSSDRFHLVDWMLAANAASATLETLVLQPCFGRVRNVDCNINKLEGLRLPRLKELKSTSFGYPSLEFLQSVCPALQQLTLNALPDDTYPEINNETEIEMHSDLYSQHQFWNQMAHIKSVDIEYKLRVDSKIVRKGYTRDGYKLQSKSGTGRQLQREIKINDQSDHGASASHSKEIKTG